jgi:hypothetical protein
MWIARKEENLPGPKNLSKSSWVFIEYDPDIRIVSES